MLSDVCENVNDQKQQKVLQLLAVERAGNETLKVSLTDTEEKLNCRLEELKRLEEQLKTELMENEALCSRCGGLAAEIEYCGKVLEQKQETITVLEEMCGQYASAKLMRFNHLLRRIRGQLFAGKGKEFWNWLGGKENEAGETESYSFNPWSAIRRILTEMDTAQAEAQLHIKSHSGVENAGK